MKKWMPFFCVLFVLFCSIAFADNHQALKRKRVFQAFCAKGKMESAFIYQQGSCTDGEHCYLLKSNADDSACSLWRVNMADWATESCSFSLPCGDGNDITYVPSKCALLIVSTSSPIAWWADPETLEITAEQPLPMPLNSISWCEEKGLYAAISCYSDDIVLMDADLRVLSTYAGPLCYYGCLTGMDCDARHLYLPCQDASGTVSGLVLYDWDGQYEETVLIPSVQVPESMFLADGFCYLAYCNNDTSIYRCEFYESEQNRTYSWEHEVLPLSAINSTDRFTVTLKQKLNLPPTEDLPDYKVQQGGAADSNIAYLTRENQVIYTCSIWKFDLKTWELLGLKTEVPIDHGNDLEYNPVTNELIAAHYRPGYNKLTFIDPDSLEVKRVLELPRQMYSVAYAPGRDQYAIGIADTYDFFITDGNFNEILSFHGKDTGLITQGIDCDENYIYCPMNRLDETLVVILVYDWEGNYVNTLTVNIQAEVENMFQSGDDWYLSFFNGGSMVCQAYLQEGTPRNDYEWE